VGDYQWTINHLAERSLASKVIYAVDDPERVAFMRFVPEVAAASQVFEAFLTGDDLPNVWSASPTEHGAYGGLDRQFARPEISTEAEPLPFERIL
jgi:hypothetical protein